MLERVSKTAAASSILLILLLALAVHPDMTWTLRVLSAAALVAGWLAATPSRSFIHIWVFLAPLAPACLRLLAGREGPVLDVVWMAGLAGGLLRVTPWSRWALDAPWNVLLGGWTLTLSLAWPILVAREIGFHAAGIRDAGAINSSSLMSAPQAATWIMYVVVAQLLGALWYEWVRGALAAGKPRMPRVIHALWMGVTAASLVAVVQGTVDLGFLSTDFWASLRRATGTMLDANSYGVCAALAAPIAFLSMRTLAPQRPAAAVAVFALNWAGLWMSGSRTAFLCGTFGTVGLLIGLWRERRSLAPARTLLTTSALIAAAIVVLIAAGTIGPIQRMLEVPIGRAGISFLWNRGGYGPIALQMTRDYPLTGVGVGSYRVLAPDYWRAIANDSLPLDNAQNWWRHQIAELGVFGGVLVIGFSVLVGWRVLTGRGLQQDVAISSTIRGLLLGLGACSLFGVPTQNPVVLLWLFSLVAWFLAFVPDTRSRDEERGPWIRAGWGIAFGLAIAYAAGHLLLATGSLGVAQRAERAHREYVAGAYPPEPLPNANEFRWTAQDARFVWPARTRWLVIRFWAHHPDIAANPVRVTLTSPCGVLFDGALTTTDPVSLGVTLPEGQPALLASLHVSRTWKPSDQGGDDDRDLGVGIVADFVSDPVLATAQTRAVTVSACKAGI
ncbi:MAG TPA: O-antigen ligase family protein [Vicinamibacterales bacterium]|nr:O-antigen ligase family protein [Vicinamibacterales bacterium]